LQGTTDGCVAKSRVRWYGRKASVVTARFLMSTPPIFKWRHFQAEIILLNVRWYCRYALSYRDLKEMMQERGVEVDHSTINRWVLKYAPELDKQIRPHLRGTNDSWKVDETYIKVKGRWKYLYRAVDSQGNTLDFLLSARRDASAAERFLRKTLNAVHTQFPRVINVDKNAAYPPAVDELKAKEQLPETTELRLVKYLNNRALAGSSIYQAIDSFGNGIWVVQHSTSNLKRV